MLNLAKVFLRSLYKTNGDNFHVLLSTRDLSLDQMRELEDIYPNLNVENKYLPMKHMAKRAKVSVEQLKEYKREVENRHVTNNNKVWKLMIAAEDRPRSLYELLLRGEGVQTPILHFDIDTLFRKNIWPIVTDALTYDCCLLLREGHNTTKAKLTISTMTWRRNERTLKFFDRWMHWLDEVPPPHRPIGYGQLSAWYAFQECRYELKYKKLGPAWGYPGRASNKPSNYIWSGAVHKLTKENCAKKFEDELEGLRCE